MAVIIPDLKMSIESESYIDAMHAVLTHAGWISCTKPALAGMTASAFRFTVHRRLHSESHTTYNWVAENFLAADFIGVTASQNAGFSFSHTFPLYQQHGIAQIKAMIDHNRGAVIWQDQFSIVVGYDDEQEVLLLSNGRDDELERLSFESFGKNISPYWYFQVYEGRITLDHLEICRESLMQAINKWETHDPMLPMEDYACGNAAYGAILDALRSGDYDHEGLPVVIRSYAAAKRDIKLYFAELETYWSELRAAAEHYALVVAAFHEAQQLLDAENGHNARNANVIMQLIELFTEAWHSEQKAIESVKTMMSETIDIRQNDIALR